MLYLLGNNKDMKNETKAKLVIAVWILGIIVLLSMTSCSSHKGFKYQHKRNCHNQMY